MNYANISGYTSFSVLSVYQLKSECSAQSVFVNRCDFISLQFVLCFTLLSQP
jgi:hypothetical protein